MKEICEFFFSPITFAPVSTAPPIFLFRINLQLLKQLKLPEATSCGYSRWICGALFSELKNFLGNFLPDEQSNDEKNRKWSENLISTWQRSGDQRNFQDFLNFWFPLRSLPIRFSFFPLSIQFRMRKWIWREKKAGMKVVKRRIHIWGRRKSTAPTKGGRLSELKGEAQKKSEKLC